MTDQHATLQCARCGCTELRAQVPAEELSAAELLALAQAKLMEDQAPKLRTPPQRPMAVVIDDSVMPASVPQLIMEVEAVERLAATGWDLDEWLTPERWTEWTSRASNVHCEVCGGLIQPGSKVRWLPANQSPTGHGQTMHVDCWEAAQR